MARIFLYSPEPVLVQGLVSLLASREEFQLVGTCDQVESLVKLVGHEKPDLVLIDMTSEVGFQLIQDLHKRAPQSRLLLWVMEISTELAYHAISLGIRGIIQKTLELETFLQALRNVSEGQLWFDKALTDSLLTARRVSLTKREGQLVTMLSQGLKNKEMATMLCVSENTIKVYLSRLFQKVGVKDRFELALYALRNVAAGQLKLDQLIVQGEIPKDHLRAE